MSETLKDNAVHIWRIELPVTQEILSDLEKTLSPDERDRLNRYQFEKDRTRFIAARGGLRTILARYLEPILAIARDEDLVPLLPKVVVEDLLDVGLVLDDQDSRHDPAIL